MKKVFVIAIISIISFSVYGQINAIREGFNLENFPEVSFIYHSNNPEEYTEEDFHYLKEAGRIRDFDVKTISLSELENIDQYTIILWEDMAHNGYGQFNFTKNAIIKFLNSVELSDLDNIAIYAYNRRNNERNALIKITGGFMSDITLIKSNVENYKHSSEYYQYYPNRSDMYTAIRESMDILVPFNGVKSIIVFTSGYSMNNSGSDSEVQVLKKAQDLHIPVYIMQYYNNFGVAVESEGFAYSTYGTFKSYIDADEAATDLIELYPNIKRRYQGNDYQITFTSTANNGDEARLINLSVKGVEVQEQLLPPPMTLNVWIKQNIVLFVILLLVLVALISSLAFYIISSRKKTKVLQEQTKRLEKKHNEDQEINNKREQERKDQEDIKRREAELERLQRLMNIKNMYPRLICDTGDKKFSYEVEKPILTIGRAPYNDLCIEKPTVSREHAEIVFNGNSFEIINKSKTNKVVLNGYFSDKAILKNNDKIGLGEVIISFHI